MDNIDWDNLVRALNLGLAALCLGLLFRKYVKYWKRYQVRTKDVWWVLASWCLVVVLGNVEVLSGWDTNFRVLFTLGALILTVKVMWQPNEVDKPTFTKEL